MANTKISRKKVHANRLAGTDDMCFT
jgi:hypothetical protein